MASLLAKIYMQFKDSQHKSHRDRLIDIYTSALAAVNGNKSVTRHLTNNAIKGDVYLLAIGKAALSMTEGAIKVLGSQVKDNLVITTTAGLLDDSTGLNIVEGAHPVPDQRSIQAGERLVEFINSVPESANFLCLVSGGTSALVEVLPEDISLEQLQQLNQWLLKSGLPIAKINAIRKRVSCIKGGRLATRLRHQKVTVLLISDVQGDTPADIGSGLFFPPTNDDLSLNPDEFPADVSQLMGMAPPMPDSNDSCFSLIDFSLVATLKKAMAAAQVSASQLGYDVIVHDKYLQGDATVTGTELARQAKQEPGKLHVWGGECTVKLPDKHGVGGRCQSLALSAAITLSDQRNWCLLAAGTDGSDGTQNVAGACVDDATLFRATKGEEGSLQIARDYLRRADAGSFLLKSDDLIKTGETGTNVADLVLAYCS